jgi:hypothetical protein
LIGKKQVDAMLHVASYNLELHQRELADFQIDGDQIDLGWDVATRCELRAQPPDNPKGWLASLHSFEAMVGTAKEEALRVLQTGLRPVLREVLGKHEDLGDIENFSCLYMVNKKHKQQQWHLDMRTESRLVVFVGLEDGTPRVQLFSEHFPTATAQTWSGTRAGNRTGDTELENYVTALGRRHDEQESLPADETFNAGDIILMFPNTLHRGPAKREKKRRRGKKWHRIVCFGTVGLKSSEKYSNLDQPTSSVLIAEVLGLGVVWAKEIWELLKEYDLSIVNTYTDIGTRQAVEFIASHVSKTTPFEVFWRKNEKEFNKLKPGKWEPLNEDQKAWIDFAISLISETRSELQAKATQAAFNKFVKLFGK